MSMMRERPDPLADEAVLSAELHQGPFGSTVQPFALGAEGGTIRGRLHRAASAPGRERAGVVLVTAGLGTAMRRVLLPTLHLVANGYTVVRFDPRNSVGVSDGEIADFTLTGLADDLLAAAAWAGAEFAGGPVSVFTASITGRAALRAAALRPELFDCVATIACVVATQDTLTAVRGDDIVERWLAGELSDPEQVDELLEHPIKLRAVEDIVDNGWASVEASVRDVEAAVAVRFVDLHGDRDPWVDTAAVRKVFGPLPHTRLIVLNDAVHEMNFASARKAMRRVIQAFRSGREPGSRRAEAAEAGASTSADAGIVVPSFESLTAQNKLERLLDARSGSAERKT